MSILTLQSLNDLNMTGVYKFVKVEDEYRFFNNSTLLNHIDVVDEREYDKIEGAGTIWIRQEHWEIMSHHSMTLEPIIGKRCYITNDIVVELQEKLNKPYQ